MGQLFNRISRMLKSQLNDNSPSYTHLVENQDDELKRIIDDLNNKKSDAGNNSNNYSKANSNYNSQNNKSNLDLSKAFELLGISRSASNDEIKSAYKTQIKQYHPDKVSSLAPEFQELAKVKTQELNQAYELLKKERGL